MDQSMYRRSIIKEVLAIKPHNPKYLTTAEEADWEFGSDYNRTADIIKTPYDQYSLHESRVKQVPVSKPHGDFVTDYPYKVIRTLRKGVFYHEYRAKTLSQTSWATYGYGKAGLVSTNATSTAYKAMVDKTKATAMLAIGEQIVKDRNTWDLLTDVAELRQSVGFTLDAVNRVKDIIRGCLLRRPDYILKGFGYKPTRRRLKHVRQTLLRYPVSQGASDTGQAFAVASELWLSYRYGLMPLLYSAEDAINVLSVGDFLTVKDYQVTIKDNAVYYERTSSSSGKPVNVKERVKCAARVSCRLRAHISYTAAMADRLNANPWQIAKTAWELVPFSFVADWFLDVGGWLDRLQLWNVIGTQTGVMTLKEHRFAKEENFLVKSPGYNYEAVKLLNEPRTVEERCFERSIVTLTSPPPTLSWGLNKWKRQVDSIALAVVFIQNSRKGIPNVSNTSNSIRH